MFRVCGARRVILYRDRDYIHSWELTWKPKRGPIKTTVPLKRGYMGFHVSLGECRVSGFRVRVLGFIGLQG